MRRVFHASMSVCLLINTAGATDESPESANERLLQVLEQLAAPEFNKRQEAQEQLRQLNAVQISALAAQVKATPSPEAAVRCTQSLRTHFLSEDPVIVEAAWEALEELQLSERSSVRDEAAWILSGNWQIRLRLAADKLAEHGALILLPKTSADAQAVRQFQQSKSPDRPAGQLRGRLFASQPVTSTQVFITDEWLGELDELQLLRRLPGLQMDNRGPFGANAGGRPLAGRANADEPTPVAVFLVAGHQLSEEETQWLKAEFGNRIQDRGQVMLGITSNAAVAGQGCPVNSVVPFGSGDAAGVQPGDMITNVGDNRISSFDDLVDELRHHSTGDSVDIKLRRIARQPGQPVPTEVFVTLSVKLRSWADYARAIQQAAAQKDELMSPDRLDPKL